MFGPCTLVNDRYRLKGGRYENVEGGNANTALVHFTGGISFSLDPTKHDAAAIFRKVHYCLSKHSGLVTCITSVSLTTRCYNYYTSTHHRHHHHKSAKISCGLQCTHFKRYNLRSIISTTYKLLQFSSPQNLRDVPSPYSLHVLLGHQTWTLSSVRQFSHVSG